MPAKKPTSAQPPIVITALAGRTVATYALKELIRATGAVLTRKARSANWLLFADKQQMDQIVEDIEAAQQKSWQWLAPLIAEKRRQFQYNELLALANRNPSISVNQLVAMSDCTIAEARKVLDDILGSDL